MNKKKIIIISVLAAVFSLALVAGLLALDNLVNKEDLLIPSDINSITIEYYPFYNLATAEVLNDMYGTNYIEKQIIHLSKEEINSIKKDLSAIYDDTKEYERCKCIVMDNYKMIINEDYEILLDMTWGKYSHDEKEYIVKMPDSLYSFISSKVEENNEKIFKKIKANSIIIETKNKKYEIDKNQAGIFINNFSYLEVNINEDYQTYDDGYIYTIYFDDSKILYLYEGCVIGYLVDKESNSESFIHVEGINKKYIEDLLKS